MAVELATGYVSIVPSLKDFVAKLSEELGAPLERQSKEQGEKSGVGFMDSFKSKALVGAGLAATALGAALTKGFADSMSIEVATDKLSAQLGLTQAESARLGGIAGDLYAGAYGESFGQVTEALGAVQSTLAGSLGPGEDALENITAKALDFATAFDTDVSAAVNSAGILISSGLARDADHAFDLMVASSQKVPAAMRENLFEATDEYSGFFSTLGFTAEESMGLLVKFSEDGEYGIDKLGDAIKEFGIRATDLGDTGAQEALALIGLNAAETSNQLLLGGESAGAAFDQIVAGLVAIDDPAKQAEAAIALFGAPLEDLNKTEIPGFLAGLQSGSTALGDVSGAAEAMGAVLNDNAATGFESFKRRAELAFAGVADAIGPVLSVAPALGGLATVAGSVGGGFSALGSAAGKVGSAVKTAGSAFASGVSAVASFGASASSAAVSTVRQTAAFVAQKTAALAAAVAQKTMTAAQWLLNAAMTANPIGLIVAGIVALVAAVVIAYKNFEPFREVVDALGRALVTGLGAAVGFVTDHWKILISLLLGPLGIAIALVVTHFDTIRDAITGTAVWVGEQVGNILQFFLDLPGNILAAVAGAAGWLLQIGVDIVTGLVEGYVSVLGTVTDTIGELAGQVVDWVGDAASFLVGKGKDVVTGLVSGYVSMLSSLASTLGALAGQVAAWVGNAAGWLVQVGRDIVQGVINGFNAWVGFLTGTLSGLPGQIRGAVGDLGGVLYSAGRSIISGLVEGIRDAIPNVRGVLGTVTNLIPDWKGPADVDRRLLRPSGRLVLEGFIAGLQDLVPTVRAELGGVTQLISATVQPSVPASSPVAVPAAAGFGFADTRSSQPIILQLDKKTIAEAVYSYDRSRR